MASRLKIYIPDSWTPNKALIKCYIGLLNSTYLTQFSDFVEMQLFKLFKIKYDSFSMHNSKLFSSLQYSLAKVKKWNTKMQKSNPLTFP